MRIPSATLLLLTFLLACPSGRSEAEEGHGPPRRGPRGPGADAGPSAGLPAEVLARQRTARVELPGLDEAVRDALAAADRTAEPLLDAGWHTGRRLRVPTDHPSIQAAVDAAAPRDQVVVAPGTYFELVVMKEGVRLVSEAGDDGDELVEVEGARLRLPRRALRTVIDGSKAQPSKHGLIDFVPGTGPRTVVDGFTLRNLPRQNHHQPGHAHAVNLRGAGAVITNCLVENNGSTGIGNHVVYRDQGQPIGKRDFRWANKAHRAEGVIYRNIVRGNLGRGIGCNHFSAPWILGNEVCGNDDSELGEPGPGIGAKHGAAPHVVGNLVHDNPGGGIMCRKGDPQGAFPIDRPTTPMISFNVAWANGADRPALSISECGSDEEPSVIAGNVVLDAGSVGIGVGRGAVAAVEDNRVGKARLAGIAVNGATVVRLNGNAVDGALGAGVTIVGGARILEMNANAVHGTGGPPYVVAGSTVR